MGLREVVRRRPALVAVVALYLAGFTAFGLATGAKLAVPYFFVVAVLALVVGVLDDRFDLGGAVLWSLAAWGAAHMAGGVVSVGPGDGDVLYGQEFGIDFIRYDRLVHAFGFGAATAACGRVLRRYLAPGRPFTIGPGVLVLLAGMGVGGINELIEFLATFVFEQTNVGGFDNTGWDLVFDLFGAAAVTTWLVARGRSAGPEDDGRSRHG